MKKTIIIKKKYEFKNLFSKGICYIGEYINMYILKNKKSSNRLAIAVSKKQGKALVTLCHARTVSVPTGMALFFGSEEGLPVALLSMPSGALLQRSRPAPAFGQHEAWPIPSPMTHRTVPCSGFRTGRN